jgi:hypothetical protein
MSHKRSLMICLSGALFLVIGLGSFVLLCLFGNRRGCIRIWGCVAGVAAYTPPNPGIITVNPDDPLLSS